MYSSQLSQGDGEGDQWDNFQETQQQQCLPPPLDLSTEYEYFINNSIPFINLNQITEKVLRHHRITITHNTNISKIFNVYEKDCYITIKKRQHYGTHCIYDVVLANFTLEIHLLNLHRSSDDHDSALSQNQIGKGGFGSVRIVKAGNNTMAIKRINFMTKAQGVDGFDIETQNAQCKQIHKAIRQYCLYKICSMLKIGPEVIFNSNYDLVCFNNCIEFIMELCELPSKRPNFMIEKGLSVQKMKKDLFQNLDLLHRLNIVHRDIKPDNIIFSESSQRFVFTDFGITHAVKEKYFQKTLTNFAGTLQYCTEEMKELLSIGQDGVNLYLNDFYGLKQSIAQFKTLQYKSSEMSRNGMSYNSRSAKISFKNNYNNSLQAPASFEQWFQSQVSEGSQKDSSNIYISSTHSLDAPMKYASQINFFEAIILYQIFESHQERIKQLTPDVIHRVIDKYTDQMSSGFAENQIKRYVLAIFYPSQSNSNITLKITDLKNTARNFGPKNEETLQIIDQIIALSISLQKSEIHQYFKNIKQSIITNPEFFEIGKFAKQMMIHLYLKNYNYFIGCSIRIMRENVRLINKLDLENSDESIGLKMTRTLICKIYIICQRLNALTIHQNKIINDLFIKIWKQQQITDLLKELQEIHDELLAYNHNSQYNFTQSPSNSRVVARFMKFAVNYVMNSDYMSSFEILQAFNFFIYRFNWTNSTDYHFYHAFINKLQALQQNHQTSGNQISLKVEIVKVYRKICRLQNHQQVNKEQYINRVKTITQDLKRLQDKKYYFTCVTQLIWIYFENRQFNDLTLETAFMTLKELQLYSCPKIQKYDSLIQINNVIGVLYHVQESYDNALVYLRNAERYIVSVYGSENLMQSYFQCILNISLTLYRQNKIESALASYHEVLSYLEKTKKVVCYEKSFIYRSIISIRLQMGIKKEQYSQIDALIKNIVYETIFTIISFTTSQFQLQNYILDLSIFSFIHIPTDIHQKIFILKTLLKYLEDNLKYFILPYDKINYMLNKIYTNDLKQPSKGLLYVWNYIRVKIKDFHDVTVEDFKLMNDFVGRLIKNNSSRRAMIIIRKYIFHIPLDLFKQRQNAFRLFHRVHANLGHPLEKVLYELTVRQCQALSNRNFSKIYQQQITHDAKMKNVLLEKWLRRV